MSVAAAAFGEREAALARGDGAATQSLGGIDSSLAWFLGAIVVSRAGLYGFDVGAMSLQQQLVDERDRAAVGATQEALCNAGDLGIFALTALGAADPVNFSRLVALATASVIVSAVLYAAWMRLFHAHPHHHDAENGDGAPGGGATSSFEYYCHRLSIWKMMIKPPLLVVFISNTRIITPHKPLILG